jgi:hypothetical protein
MGTKGTVLYIIIVLLFLFALSSCTNVVVWTPKDIIGLALVSVIILALIIFGFMSLVVSLIEHFNKKKKK